MGGIRSRKPGELCTFMRRGKPLHLTAWLMHAVFVMGVVSWGRVARAQNADDSHSRARLLCTDSPVAGCHVLAYPAFVPSTLSPSYVGIRVGGGYHFASASPLPAVPGEYQRVTGSGSFDFSKELWAERIAIFGSLSGSLGMGANASSILGTDTEAMGGLNVGLLSNVLIRRSVRLAIVSQVARHYGESMLLERAAGQLRFVPNTDKIVLNTFYPDIGPAVNRVPMRFVETVKRADFAWLFLIKPWLSYQGAIGVEAAHRYYRGDEPKEAPDIHYMVGPRIGTAFEIDFSTNGCGANCMPLAVVFEHQFSPTRLKLNTLEPLQSPPHTRIMDHLVAVGVHYANDRHSDFDLGLTAYGHWNVPRQFSMTVKSAPELATEYGGQVMARYCW